MGDQQGVIDLEDGIAACGGGAAEPAGHINAAVLQGQAGVILHGSAGDLAAQSLALAGQADVGMLQGEIGALAGDEHAAQVAPAGIQLHILRRSIGDLAGQGLVPGHDLAVPDLQGREGGLFLGHGRHALGAAGAAGAAGAFAVVHGRTGPLLIGLPGKNCIGDPLDAFHTQYLPFRA